jgi:hypothetical protein
MEQTTSTKPKGYMLPLIVFLLPLLLFVPYRWLVFDSAASGHIVTPRLDEEHRRVHLGVVWLFTFGPFAIICFLTSLVMFIRRIRRSRIARAGATA